MEHKAGACDSASCQGRAFDGDPLLTPKFNTMSNSKKRGKSQDEATANSVKMRELKITFSQDVPSTAKWVTRKDKNGNEVSKMVETKAFNTQITQTVKYKCGDEKQINYAVGTAMNELFQFADTAKELKLKTAFKFSAPLHVKLETESYRLDTNQDVGSSFEKNIQNAMKLSPTPKGKSKYAKMVYEFAKFITRKPVAKTIEGVIEELSPAVALQEFEAKMRREELKAQRQVKLGVVTAN
jgi:hypothetical protein